MPRNSRKLRLLILATLASSGATTGFAVQAGPAAWSCQVDPLTGGWSCAQTGDKAQAEQAVRMAERAAGNPEPTPEQIEIATSEPNTVTPPSDQPLAETMAAARAAELERDAASVAEEAVPAEPVVAEPVIEAVAAKPEPVRQAAPSKAAPLADIERNVIDLKPSETAVAKPAPEPAPEPEAPTAVEPAQATRPPQAPTKDEVIAASAPEPDGDDSTEAQAEPQATAPETVAATPTESPPEATPREDRYALARRAGQLNDNDVAALIAARESLDLGEAEQTGLQSEALQRLQALYAQDTGDRPAPAAPDRDHIPEDWPRAMFADDMPVIPAHAEHDQRPTHAEIDSRRAWALCGANSDPSMTRDIPLEAAANRETLPTVAVADDVQGKRQQYYTLFGDAELSRGDQRLQGDIIHYDATTERADAEGNVRYREAGLSMDSDWGYLVMANDTGEFGASRFYLPDRHARGTAEHMDIVSRTVTQGQTTTYTTCNYGVDTWYLDSEEVELDRGEGVGTATNTWVKVAGVPIAYFPWLSFPIDDRRKSGLLTPSFGNSEINGTELSIPYYWNIAPHRDATITPYLMSERGLRIDTEFRYVNPDNSGMVRVDILPSDDIYEKDRGLFHWEHYVQLAEDLDLEIFGSHVSDPYYFKDFEDTLFGENISTLPRYTLLTYTPQDWLITARLQEDYLVNKTVPKASRPYRRLPEITASTSHYDLDTGLDMSFKARSTYFQNSQKLEGGRIELNPRVAYPMRESYGYVTPEIEVNHTQWHLGPANAGDADRHQYLTVPSVAVDSGIYFDKEFEFDNDSYIHSIEPRIRYTYTPNISQSSHPSFDSSRQKLSYSALFQNNRFTGGDRYGDANQVAVGITSRIMDPNYADLLSFSVGELFYFEDREVTIGGQTDEDRSANSDLVAELDAHLPNGLSATANFRWDHKDSETPDHNWQVEYLVTPEDYVRYEYTHRRGVSRESELEFAWSLSPQWHLVGIYEYDHLTASNVSNLFGLEYETCCWAARVAAQTDYQTVTTTGANNVATLQSDTSLMFQVELKGLAGLGNNLKEFFGSSSYY